MQFLKITRDMTIAQLADLVGERNLDYILNINNLDRTVDVGAEFYTRTVAISDGDNTDYQMKLHLLNKFVGDSDVYEKAALGTYRDWNSLAQYGCFADSMCIPVEVKLPPSDGILGNGEPIPTRIHEACTNSLKEYQFVDPTIFAEYNATFAGDSYGVTYETQSPGRSPFQWAALPWGEVSLYSSLNNVMLQFPVYPEELSDGVSASYEQMPDMLYQYEPWQVYKSSGPREQDFTFEFHRDMWTGDHRDGNANYLIRGCQANCFPNYSGSLVTAPTVTLYIHGENYITGVMTKCTTDWSGPIGLDGFYLMCKLSISITEVSPIPLNYNSVRGKRLIQ